MGLHKHLKYASYVLRHKAFVFAEACKLGIPLQGALHDLSKLRPSEWFPYADFFFAPKNGVQTRDKTGYYKPTDTGDKAFDHAWLLHQKRNPHHWQFWILPEDSGGVKVLEMPLQYRKEMVADWRGAGKVQGKPDTLGWYVVNRSKMQLGVETRNWVEHEIGYDTYLLKQRAAELEEQEAQKRASAEALEQQMKHPWNDELHPLGYTTRAAPRKMLKEDVDDMMGVAATLIDPPVVISGAAPQTRSAKKKTPKKKEK
jgi:Family of unknown function (DUF5662)